VPAALDLKLYFDLLPTGARPRDASPDPRPSPTHASITIELARRAFSYSRVTSATTGK
jgi:hypothetical protein